jgi:DNA-binding GntR family transcriptional regulator
MAKTPNRADQAYLGLKRAIIEQALQPGDKLPEDEVGALFAMSRTLVRQVFSRLNNDGLIKTGGKRSATVVTPSLDDAVATFQVRRALEREVVRLAALKWSAELKASLTEHVAKEVAAVSDLDKAKSIRLAGEFHILLAALCGNGILSRYVSEVVTRCSVVLAVFGRPHSAECGVQEHTDVIRALDAGDVETAVKLMDHHIGEVESRALISSGNAEQPSLAQKIQPYTALDVSQPGATKRRKGNLRLVNSNS